VVIFTGCGKTARGGRRKLTADSLLLWQNRVIRIQMPSWKKILFFFQLPVSFIGMAWGKEGLQVNSAALPSDLGCFVPSFTSLTHISV